MQGVVHFKFKSALSYDSVQFDGAFVSIGELKELIAEKKGLGKDVRAELVLSDPTSGEEYRADTQMLPRNTSVLVRRVPVAKQQLRSLHSTAPAVAARASSPTEASYDRAVGYKVEDGDFGGDLFAQQAGRSVVKDDEEDQAIQNLLEKSATTWQNETRLMGRGRGRGGRGRSLGAPLGGRAPGMVPPPGYICFRCGQGGHYISDCPTNGDPTYDVKRIRQPVGIPMTRLVTNEDGGLILPDGQVGSLLPNEDVFLREMAGLPGKGADEPAKPPAAGSAKPEATPPVAVPRAPSPLLQPQQPLQQQQQLQADAAATAEEVAKPQPADEPSATVAGTDSKALVPVFGGEEDMQNAFEPDRPKQHSVQPQPRELSPQPTSGNALVLVQPAEEKQLAAVVEQRPSFGAGMPFPKGMLPSGPAEVVLRAFQREVPLTRREFQTLQDGARRGVGLDYLRAERRRPSQLQLANQRSPSPAASGRRLAPPRGDEWFASERQASGAFSDEWFASERQGMAHPDTEAPAVLVRQPSTSKSGSPGRQPAPPSFVRSQPARGDSPLPRRPTSAVRGHRAREESPVQHRAQSPQRLQRNAKRGSRRAGTASELPGEQEPAVHVPRSARQQVEQARHFLPEDRRDDEGHEGHRRGELHGGGEKVRSVRARHGAGSEDEASYELPEARSKPGQPVHSRREHLKAVPEVKAKRSPDRLESTAEPRKRRKVALPGQERDYSRSGAVQEPDGKHRRSKAADQQDSPLRRADSSPPPAASPPPRPQKEKKKKKHKKSKKHKKRMEKEAEGASGSSEEDVGREAEEEGPTVQVDRWRPEGSLEPGRGARHSKHSAKVPSEEVHLGRNGERRLHRKEVNTLGSGQPAREGGELGQKRRSGGGEVLFNQALAGLVRGSFKPKEVDTAGGSGHAQLDRRSSSDTQGWELAARARAGRQKRL